MTLSEYGDYSGAWTFWRESWEFRTRYQGPMQIEWSRWRPWRPWRVTFTGVCVPFPGGWLIYDFYGRGATLEAACQEAQRQELELRVREARAWAQK